MNGVFAAIGPSAYWYLARGTGMVSLVLLTVSVVLGILGSIRFAAGPRWPRFAIDSLHRDVSLLVIVLLVLHIVTSVLDGFAPIALTDGLIPFISPYRPLWLGLGTLAFDIMLALVITSLVRRRLGYRSWRAVHWLAYASWPVAVLHGLGTGTDTTKWWNLMLTGGCILAVAVAAWFRVARAREAVPDGLRAGAVSLTALTPLGLAIFTLAGPLAPHWSRRAGTPASLLPRTVSSGRRGSQANVPTGGLHVPFNASLNGTLTQTPEPAGAIVDLAMRVSGGARGQLRVRLAGAPLNGGGLSMTGSQVDLLVRGAPSVLEGQIVSLQGSRFVARVADSAGTVLDLQANLQIDQQSGAVTGSLSAAAAGSGQ